MKPRTLKAQIEKSQFVKPEDPQSDSSLEDGKQEFVYGSNIVSEVASQSPGSGQNGSSPFRFNKRALLITGAAVALITSISISSLLYVNFHSKKHTSGKSNASYAVTAPSTKGLSQSAALLLVNQTDRLNVNGQLRVGNTIVLTPSAAPSTPTAGQLYYSQVTNTPYYYNGGKFVSLEPTVIPLHVNAIGGNTGDIGVGSGLQVTAGQLSLTDSISQSLSSAKVKSLQGQTGDISLGAGSGIAISGTTISNNGLLSLTGTANQISVLTSNGIATISLPQNIDVSASPTFAGLFLTNTSGSNLVNLKALNPSGSSDATIQIPSIAGGSIDTVCLLSLSNCVGSGGSVSTTGGSQNYITKYNNAGANQLTSSQIYDNGISVAIGNNSPSGLFSVGASSQFQVSGSGAITASDLALTSGSLTTNSVQRLTNAGALTNITGYTQTSGNFDASASGGTFKTSTGLVSLNGNTSISGVNTLTVGTGATTLGGILGVTGLGTFNSGLTLTGGSTFTNASSSLFSSVAIANHPVGGNIGTAAATVNVATTFDITQTTAGQTLTLSNPTVTTSGRVVYVNSLAGNAAFTMYGVAITAGSSASFIWNGSAWVATSTGGTGANNIGNLNGGTANANAATITGSTLFLQSASTSYAGLVDTATQSFGGAKTFTGASTFENSVDSTNAFQIQNSAGTSNLLVADTTNTRIGIGKSSPSTVLDVAQNNGNDASITLTNSSAGKEANLNLVANSNWSVVQFNGTGQSWIAGQNGSSNFVIYDNSTGKTPFTINSGDDSVLFKNGTDSTTAFQIQNTAGTAIFAVDTVNSNVNVTGVLNVSSRLGLSGTAQSFGSISKAATAGASGFNQYDVVVLDPTAPVGATKVIQTTTARNPNVYGVALFTATSGNSASIAIGGNITINVDSGAVNVGDQLVTSTSAGMATSDNSATTGIIGTALSSKAAGSNGTVSVSVRPVSGQYSPRFQNASDSTSAFQVQNAAGTGVIGVDTTNSRLYFGGDTGAYLYRATGSTIGASELNVDSNFNAFGPALFKSSNSTTAFQIQNAAGTSNLLVADTTNTRIGIGATPANSLLTVGTNTTSSAGGIYFGTDTNLYRGGANLLTTDDWFTAGSGLTVTSTLSAQGSAIFKNSSDSTTAVQIQNAAGTNLFIADTTNNRIGIGASPANGVLTVGTNTTTAAGGIYFGTDTDLYRNAASWLKTDGSLAVAGSMNVTGANMFVSANTVFQNNADSTTAFQVQNAAGTITVLDVDTTNGRVGIGTSSPAYNLSVAGPASLFGNAGLPGVATGLYLGTAVNAQDLQVYRAAASSLGFGRYNGSWLESARFDANGNFGIGTGATVSAMLDVAGNVLFKNGSDSTTAFQIQNAAGTSNLLVADTTNTKLGIGMAPSSGGTTLQVTGNISSTTGIFDPLKFVINSNSATSGRISKQAIAGLGGVSGGDVVVYNSSDQVVDTTIARDSRIYGIATGAAISGAGVEIVIGGNAQVTADTGAVNVGDQLVTSTTSGQVTVNNSATTGILGIATTSKSAGSSGLVGVIVNVVAGQYSPTFQNANDSTTAFQIQNAAGSSNLFVADTTNTKLGIGAAPSSGGSILQVTGSISATQGFSTPASFTANTSATGGYFGKGFNVGSTGVNQNDVVVLADDAGNQRVIDSTTARDPRVWGVSTATAASGSTATIAISGNYQVTADTGAVAIGDQLVVSATSGEVATNNNATTGILGTALSSKSAGSSGLVNVAIRPAGGQSTPHLQNTADSTSAFLVQNAAGTSNVFDVDTSSNRVGIGTASLSQSLTINQGSIADQMGNPTGLNGTPSASGGSLATNTYYYKVSAIDGAGGETFVGNEVTAAVTGPTGSVALTWTPPSGNPASYRIYRGTSPGGENVYYTSAIASFTDIGAANTGGSPTGTPTAYNYKVTHSGSSWFNGGNIGIGTANPAQTLSVLGTASVQSSTNSTTAFQIQNAAGTSNLLVADTTNTKLGIGQAPTAGGATLQVSGQISATTTISAGSGLLIATSSNTSGVIDKMTIVGTGGVSTNDVVALNGSAQAIDTTTARDTRVYGVSTGTFALGGTTNVVISGDFQVTADTGAVSAGDQLVTSTSAGQVTVDNTATSGILGIALSSKGAGSSGLVSVMVRPVGGVSTPNFTPTADSTTAFQIQNAARTNNYLTVDTSNNRIGIFGNPSGSGARLQVAAAGIAGLSVNETGASDLLDLQNNATNVVTVGATGNTTYKNSSDSTTAFQVQDTGGNEILGVDTTNGRVSIGNADTYLYRQSASILRTGGQLSVDGTLLAYNSLIVHGNANVIQNYSDSTTAFQIQNAASNTIFNTNTSTGVVTINSHQSQAAALQVISGNATQYAGIQVGTNVALGSLSAAGANGNYLTDSLQSDVVIKSESTNALLLGNSTGASVLSILNGKVGIGIRAATASLDVRGDALFKNASDSTTAFQIQNAAGTQLIQVDTSTTPNMISNGGFEVNANGWSVKGSATISRDTSNQYEGNASLLITTTATANDGAFFPVTLAPNTQYTLSYLYKTSTFTGSLLLVPGEQDISGTDVNCGANGMWGAVWVHSSCTFTTGATITSSNIFFKQSDATARSIWIDAVQLQTGAAAGPYQVGQIQLNGVLSSPVSIKPTQGTTRAFAVYSSDNTTSVLAIDNINNRVGVNTIGNPQNSLGVNDLTVQDSAAQLAVGTGGTANKGLIVQGVASQSADLFQLQSSTGSLLDNFTAAGALGVGGPAANSVLTVGTNTTTAAGGITFGTDTDLYRVVGGYLKTDAVFQAGSGLSTYGNSLVKYSSATAYQVQDSSGNVALNVSSSNYAGGWNAANATLDIGMDSGTNRSINAAGTINASGADYAEWIPWTASKPSAGSIVTYQGSNYVVSSPQTAAFVGNDRIDETNAIMVTFAGQVPVKVTGEVMTGDILVSNGDGTAKAISPSTAGLIDYLSKIGIAQASSSDAGVKLIEASIGTTAANVDQSSLQAASANFSDLNVSGATTLNNLTVVGTATIANLTVTGATNVGDITVSGHIITGNKSGATTATVQSVGGAGSGSSCNVSGNDTNGQISITFGAGSMVGVAACKINFGSNYTAAPKPVFTMASYNATNNPTPYVNASDVGSFSIGFTTPPPTAGTYLINYFNAQ